RSGRALRSLVVVSSGGYGYTEAVLGRGDAHHRAAGSLSVEGRPLPWLSLALRLDGRYDVHVSPATPPGDGLGGDPRFYVRVDHALAPTLRAGLRGGLWLPGAGAP